MCSTASVCQQEKRPTRSQPTFQKKKEKKRGPNSVGRGQSSKYVMLVSRKENEQIAI
jgi:hypothetical protein